VRPIVLCDALLRELVRLLLPAYAGLGISTSPPRAHYFRLPLRTHIHAPHAFLHGRLFRAPLHAHATTYLSPHVCCCAPGVHWTGGGLPSTRQDGYANHHAGRLALVHGQTSCRVHGEACAASRGTATSRATGARRTRDLQFPGRRPLGVTAVGVTHSPGAAFSIYSLHWLFSGPLVADDDCLLRAACYAALPHISISTCAATRCLRCRRGRRWHHHRFQHCGCWRTPPPHLRCNALRGCVPAGCANSGCGRGRGVPYVRMRACVSTLTARIHLRADG